MLALEADGLECIRDDRTLFRDLAFRLQAGQALLLEGRNGSGKTSLLRILCGIRLPDAGSVSWCGTDISRLGPDYHEHTAYVGHRDGIKQDLTPLENLAVARALGKPSEATLEALVVDAPLWILDEPFTSLDVHGIGLIENLLEDHTRNGGMLAMTSHHTVNLVNTPVHPINLSA